MFFRKLIGLFFLGLLVFAVLGAFGRTSGSRYDSAYRQGFIDGQQAAESSSKVAPQSAEDAATAAPSSSSGTQVYYRDHEYFFPGRGFPIFLIPLFAFGLFFLSSAKRRRHGRRGHWGYGPCGSGRGPWKQGSDTTQEKSPDDIDDGPIMQA